MAEEHAIVPRQVLAVGVVLVTPAALLLLGRVLSWLSGWLPDWASFGGGIILYPSIPIFVALVHARCQHPPWSRPILAVATSIASCVVATIVARVMNPTL